MVYKFVKTDDNNRIVFFNSINELLDFEYDIRLKYDLKNDNPNEFDEILNIMELENYTLIETF